MPEPDFIENPYSYEKPFWVDTHYADPQSPLYRTLILGESTYEDPPKDDPQWIRKEQDPKPYRDKTGKLKKEQPDKTFSRLLWVTRGKRRETCFDTYRLIKTPELETWFNLFAFHNFISCTIGSRNNRSRIEERYVASKSELVQVCEVVKPKYVWVLWPHTRQNGKVGSSIAVDTLVKDCKVKSENIEVMSDFCGYGLSYQNLIASWEGLQEKMRRANASRG